MAAQKRARGGSGGVILQLILIIIITGAFIAFTKINNISSIDDFIDWTRATSTRQIECETTDVECRLGEEINVAIPDGELPPIDLTNDTPPADLSPEELKEYAKAVKKQFQNSLTTVKILNEEDAVNVEYKRSDWKHWTSEKGSECDTRKNVLIAQGKNVEVDKKTCKVLSGNWEDLYGEGIITDPSKIDIDHVIPLAYAARHGGQDWPKEKKEQFANDMTQLFAVSASENRSKSDKGPSEYMPKKEFQCTYSKVWTSTALKYDISITPDDLKALEKGLRNC